MTVRSNRSGSTRSRTRYSCGQSGIVFAYVHRSPATKRLRSSENTLVGPGIMSSTWADPAVRQAHLDERLAKWSRPTRGSAEERTQFRERALRRIACPSLGHSGQIFVQTRPSRKPQVPQVPRHDNGRPLAQSLLSFDHGCRHSVDRFASSPGSSPCARSVGRRVFGTHVCIIEWRPMGNTRRRCRMDTSFASAWHVRQK